MIDLNLFKDLLTTIKMQYKKHLKQISNIQMKKIFLSLLITGINFQIYAQQFIETGNQLETSKEIVAPVLLLSNEIRLANTFVPSDPIIGTMDNSGFGINIHKSLGIGFAFDDVHKVIFRPNGNVLLSGKLEASELKVTVSPTADFVFEENYKLLSLEFIEDFVKKYKHLPLIASGDEMRNNGVNIGEFQIQLLQKVEELTIYTINQQNEINRQAKEINELKLIVGKLLDLQ